MKILLLGKSDTKRTIYFRKAATELNVNLDFCELEDYKKISTNDIVKIDPPVSENSQINEIESLNKNYYKILDELQKKDCKFLNAPNAIKAALDKKLSKKIIQKNKIHTPFFFEEPVFSFDKLNELMTHKNIFSVFIKPNFGSGASGVAAYRFFKNKHVLFHSSKLFEKTLINTKRIYKIENYSEIKKITDVLLKQNCIIEEWIPKASFNDYSYDLRCVCQFGKLDFILVRLSKSPMTNLHLNNKPLDFDELNLSAGIKQKIYDICEKTMKSFENLNYAGLDIGLTQNTNEPFVIEINGQGDLIYKDIFNENIIYKNQIREMIKYGNS